jgi:hypothetical protein
MLSAAAVGTALGIMACGLRRAGIQLVPWASGLGILLALVY